MGEFERKAELPEDKKDFLEAFFRPVGAEVLCFFYRRLTPPAK